MSDTDVPVDAAVELPAVVHRLLQQLGERRLMPLDDALAVLLAATPRTAGEAIGALVASGGITNAQGTMLRDAFIAGQREHLALLLGAAFRAGLATEEHAAWATAGFDAELFTSTPESYLLRHDVLTRGQLHALQAANTGREPTTAAGTPGLPAAEGAPPSGPSTWSDRTLGHPPSVAGAVFAVTALLGAAVATGLWLSVDFSFRHERALLGMSVTSALVLAPVFTYLLAAHLPGWKRLAFAVCAFAVANVGLGDFAVPLGLVGMRWLDGRPESRAKQMGVAALLGLGLLLLTFVVVNVAGASMPSWVLERALREARGDQFVVFSVLVVPKALLTGAAGLAAAWCVRGGQRFATPDDLLRHLARARWTWPLLGWAVGSALSGVVAVMTDERFTLTAYVVTTVFAAVAVAFHLARVRARAPASPSASDHATARTASGEQQGTQPDEVRGYALERMRALSANRRVVVALSLVATAVLLAVTSHWSADSSHTRTVKDVARLVLFFCTAVGFLRAFAPTSTVAQSLRHGLVATLMLRHPVSLPGATLEWVLPAFITTGGLLLMRRNLGRRVQVPHLALAGAITLALGILMELCTRFASGLNGHINLVRDLLTSSSSSFRVADGVAIVALEFNVVWFTSAFVATWLVLDDGEEMPAPSEVVQRFLLSPWSIVPLAFGLGGVASFARALVRDRVVDAEGMIAWGVLALLPVWWVAGRKRGSASRSPEETSPQEDDAAQERRARHIPMWIPLLGLIACSLGAVVLGRTALQSAANLSTGEGLREVVMDGGGTFEELAHVLGFGPTDTEIVAFARDQILLSDLLSGRVSSEAELPSDRPPFEVQGARFGAPAEMIEELGLSAFRTESFALAGVAALMFLALISAGLLSGPRCAHAAPAPWRLVFERFGPWIMLFVAFLWFGIGAGGPFYSGRLAWLGAVALLVTAVLTAGGGRSIRLDRARSGIVMSSAVASALVGLVLVAQGVMASPSSLPGALPEPALPAQPVVQVGTPPRAQAWPPTAAASAPAAAPQPPPLAPPLVEPPMPDDATDGSLVADSTSLEVDQARLLRAHAVRLFSEHGGPARPFRWTDINGRKSDLAVSVDASRRLTLTMTSGGVVSSVAQYACGPGPCTAFVNQREDGLLVVRFTTDASGGSDGSHLFMLHRQDESSGARSSVEVARWAGSLAENTEGLAPVWAQVAPAARAPVSLTPLPTVACDTDEDCARLAMTVWLSLNHRYALAYAQEALRINPRSTSALYTSASIHASVGDAARAAQYLSQLAGVGTRDAAQQLGRVARDHDFDAVRADARVTAVLR